MPIYRIDLETGLRVEVSDHPSILSTASGPAKILAHLRAHGWRQSGGPGQTPMWSLNGPSMSFTVVDPRGLQGSELAWHIDDQRGVLRRRTRPSSTSSMGSPSVEPSMATRFASESERQKAIDPA